MLQALFFLARLLAYKDLHASILHYSATRFIRCGVLLKETGLQIMPLMNVK